MEPVTLRANSGIGFWRGSKQTRVMAISKDIRLAAGDWFSIIRLSGGCLGGLVCRTVSTSKARCEA